MNLESELKIALQRVDPPDGFARRVMEACGTEGFSAPAGVRNAAAPRWHRAIAAAILIAITIAGWGVRETLHARNELLTAMRIASDKAAHVQQEVNRR